jgi:lipoyl(octanoyl) transferase
VDDTARPGWANMSIDTALLDRAEFEGESWFRLYRWDPPCLSFGRHEPASRRYNRERIRELGIDVVRRPTGGRAVWHGRELTYAVACPCSRFDSLRSAYLEIHALLLHTLTGLGFRASLAPGGRTAPLDTGACFSQPAGGEVLLDGRKVIGSAQVRRKKAMLQHGSILLEDEQGRVADLFSDRSTSFPAHRSFPTGLDAVHADELIAAIFSTTRSRWIGVTEPAADPYPVLERAAVHFTRFRSDAWTWAR